MGVARIVNAASNRKETTMSEEGGMKWGSIGGLGGLFLAGYLIFVGVSVLIGIAVPAWVGAALALVAGVLILIGR